MSKQALQEPAILHLIFIELDQQDLFHIQAVCQTWRTTILTSKVLLQVLSLRPRLLKLATKKDDKEEQLEESTEDPLLVDVFRSFFKSTPVCCVPQRGNAGPWTWTAERHWTPDLREYEKFRYPEASWRRMLPWNDPPPTQLQVHIQEKTRGTIALLNSDNQETWLTFGLIWDIVENAWFHGNPYRIYWVLLDGPGKERAWEARGPLPPDAKVSEDVRQSTRRTTGKINLELRVDERPPTERVKEVEEALKDRMKSIRKQERRIIKPCGTKPRRVTLCERHLFTDEFHVEGGVAFGDVQWDEIWTYEREVGEEQQVPNVSEISRRKFLGWLLGRR